MSRADLSRARQLVRLRDIAFERALRDLGEATGALDLADAAVTRAIARREAAAAHHVETRAALVEAPADAATGLARIAVAAERETAAISAADEAELARRAAEDLVITARATVRKARARLDAMTGRSDTLLRTVVRADEERATIETEEGAAAMRSAA
ncbi:hypothetical protein [Glacieibacterium sp.]|uniref:hypothetical protein n=1 Tax=Glacieibacterium sp. TaxID=2860237 RepID=UPI003AFF8F9F